MKLRNKKTGEIVYATMMASYGGGELQIRYYPIDRAYDTHFKEYRSIAELNEEWEDYHEEPNRYYLIDLNGEVSPEDVKYKHKGLEELGLTFETKEEAEQAVRKLKAWKRLKDKGFKFDGIKEDYTRFNTQNPFRDGKRYLHFNKSEDDEWIKENWKDLYLLFSSEEG